ncbi:MAG: hypothetical protein LBO66_13720 [Deltaproteobacteria bacterium]|jgi:hypothetical protein|nr:hypothetical protein [Deltaproteobacteria bacterium]
MPRRHLALSLFLPLLWLASCSFGGPNRLVATFAPLAQGATLTPGTVMLVVADARANRSLVGPEALGKDLFKGSQNGVMDLSVTLPTGQVVARSLLTVEGVVFEAVKERLRLLGINAETTNANAKCRITINIADFVVDARGSDVIAHVRLESVVDRPGLDLVTRSWAEADSSKFKLIGDMGGDESLSQALSLCVNRLDFSSLNRF